MKLESQHCECGTPKCVASASGYLDVYFRRVGHLGDTAQERALNSGIKEFEYMLASSPSAVDLSTETGPKFFFRGVITTNKQDMNRLTKNLMVALGVPIEVGVVINWGPEKWIIYQKERNAYEPHQVFRIIRCNFYVRWVDENGAIKGSWAHVASSIESKIKENFRTWRSLITPQPNQYAEIIMPSLPIERHTRIIIMQNGWYIIELDITSVTGLMFLSIGETKVNSLRDDVPDDLADADRIAQFGIEIPQEPIIARPNMLVTPIFIIYKDGKVQLDIKPKFTVSGNLIYNKEDSTILAKAAGQGSITISLIEQKISVVQEVLIQSDENLAGIIVGNDMLKLDRVGTYELQGPTVLTDFSCSIDNTELATIIGIDENKCIIRANNHNRLGTVTLTMSANQLHFTRTIQIIPLW